MKGLFIYVVDLPEWSGGKWIEAVVLKVEVTVSKMEVTVMMKPV